MWRHRFFSCLFAFLLIYLLLHPQVQESESANLLSVAQEVLAGRSLYGEILTSVSPFTLVVYLIPVALAGLLHLQTCFLANCLALVLVFLSLTMVEKELDARCEQAHDSRWLRLRPLITGGALGLVFYQVIFLKSVAQPYNLLAFALLPYLVSASGPRAQSVLPSCALAALAVLLNPLSLLFLAFLELLRFSSRPGKLSWSVLRKESLFLRVLVMVFAFALIAGPLYLVLGMRQYPLVFQLLLSRFAIFNDALRYVQMSPDRRDLLYFWVFSVILALPLSRRLPLLQSALALSLLGFLLYLLSISLLTSSSLLMVAASFLTLGLCLSYFWLKKFGLPEVFTRHFKIKFWTAFAYCLFLPLAFYLFSSFGLKSGLSDLAVFSEALLAKTKVGDTVFCFSGQSRPAFPLLTQTGRRCGFLAESSILLDLKRHRERFCPLGTMNDALCQWQDALNLKIKEELAGDKRPVLVMVEDGDMKDYLRNNGIETVLNEHYLASGYVSLLNEEDMKKHEPFEYIGYRTGFSLYTARP